MASTIFFGEGFGKIHKALDWYNTFEKIIVSPKQCLVSYWLLYGMVDPRLRYALPFLKTSAKANCWRASFFRELPEDEAEQQAGETSGEEHCPGRIVSCSWMWVGKDHLELWEWSS